MGKRTSPESGDRPISRSDRSLGRVRELMGRRRPGKGLEGQVQGLLAEAKDASQDDPKEGEDIRTTAETEVELDLDGELPHGEVEF